MKHTFCIAAALVALLPACAFPEVTDSSAAGFTVKVTVTIQAAPAEVYRRLFRIGEWWSPAHTFSGDAKNLSIEEKPMGCFCERLPNGGAVRHMEVINFSPGKALVLSGALGPLQPVAATGVMGFQLTPKGNGTELLVAYAVGGYLPAGMNTYAGPVDTVLTEQVTRLKNFIEKGNPEGK